MGPVVTAYRQSHPRGKRDWHLAGPAGCRARCESVPLWMSMTLYDSAEGRSHTALATERFKLFRM